MNQQIEITGIMRHLNDYPCEGDNSFNSHFFGGLNPEYSTISRFSSKVDADRQRVLEQLMERALAQNPDLALSLRRIYAEQAMVDELRMQEQIAMYRDWQAKRDAERKANRHRRYNDMRNYNKLNAIRRDSYYKSLPRIEQIEIEIANYWKPYNLPLPPELESERNAILAASSMKAG